MDWPTIVQSRLELSPVPSGRSADTPILCCAVGGNDELRLNAAGGGVECCIMKTSIFLSARAIALEAAAAEPFASIEGNGDSATILNP